MKAFNKIMMATALVATSATAFDVPAEARTRHHYYGRTTYRHKVCRYSRGTTGLVAGGVGGAVVGSKVIGGGLLGVAAGAVGGALAGRAIDRSSTAHRRCYYTR
jgi:outer membrane lipoprotein SlyB